ncbi:MAG TPA: site-specific DNA-methyltransferase [Candidatus Angelobacter sp.]|jgi:site-specific DNA-methyltransferase (adenine-specific)|nr:site-specific DNA-methyltransferase [Candidatus Angelobacter sp.]
MTYTTNKEKLGLLLILLVLAAAPLLAWRRHDPQTLRNLLVSYSGLGLLVRPKSYYKSRGVTIYCGDCKDILPTLPRESVDMVWTDPPYGNNNQQGDLADQLNRARGAKSRPIANDSRKHAMRIVDLMLDESAGLLKRVGCCCVCSSGGGGANGPMFAWLANRLDADGLTFCHCVIWDKKNPGLGWRYRRRYEMVMVAHRMHGRLSWADPSIAVPNIICCSAPHRRCHPNEKPESLVEQFIQVHTRPGDLILDPFMGSGTTLLVARRLGRRAIGIELEEQYCRTAVERIEACARN